MNEEPGQSQSKANKARIVMTGIRVKRVVVEEWVNSLGHPAGATAFKSFNMFTDIVLDYSRYYNEPGGTHGKAVAKVLIDYPTDVAADFLLARIHPWVAASFRMLKNGRHTNEMFGLHRPSDIVDVCFDLAKLRSQGHINCVTEAITEEAKKTFHNKYEQVTKAAIGASQCVMLLEKNTCEGFADYLKLLNGENKTLEFNKDTNGQVTAKVCSLDSKPTFDADIKESLLSIEGSDEVLQGLFLAMTKSQDDNGSQSTSPELLARLELLMKEMKEQGAQSEPTAEQLKKAQGIQADLDTLHQVGATIGRAFSLLGKPKEGQFISDFSSGLYSISSGLNALSTNNAALGMMPSFVNPTMMVINGIMTIASCFMGGGSDNSMQVLMEQIQKLTELVQTMREEMHDRFDQVDRALFVIHQQTIDYFIAARQQNISLSVMANRIYQAITSTREENYKYFQTIFLEDFSNSAIEYRNVMAEEEEFDDIEAKQGLKMTFRYAKTKSRHQDLIGEGGKLSDVKPAEAKIHLYYELLKTHQLKHQPDQLLQLQDKMPNLAVCLSAINLFLNWHSLTPALNASENKFNINRIDSLITTLNQVKQFTHHLQTNMEFFKHLLLECQELFQKVRAKIDLEEKQYIKLNIVEANKPRLQQAAIELNKKTPNGRGLTQSTWRSFVYSGWAGDDSNYHPLQLEPFKEMLNSIILSQYDNLIRPNTIIDFSLDNIVLPTYLVALPNNDNGGDAIQPVVPLIFRSEKLSCDIIKIYFLAQFFNEGTIAFHYGNQRVKTHYENIYNHGLADVDQHYRESPPWFCVSPYIADAKLVTLYFSNQNDGRSEFLSNKVRTDLEGYIANTRPSHVGDESSLEYWLSYPKTWYPLAEELGRDSDNYEEKVTEDEQQQLKEQGLALIRPHLEKHANALYREQFLGATQLNELIDKFETRLLVLSGFIHFAFNSLEDLLFPDIKDSFISRCEKFKTDNITSDTSFIKSAIDETEAMLNSFSSRLELAFGQVREGYSGYSVDYRWPNGEFININLDEQLDRLQALKITLTQRAEQTNQQQPPQGNDPNSFFNSSSASSQQSPDQFPKAHGFNPAM